MVTLQDYNNLLEDRPTKFSPEDVGYREAEGRERCGRCIHFYERRLDRHGVCEILRPDEDDEDGIEPDYTCNFFSHDGTEHPLMSDDNEND